MWLDPITVRIERRAQVLDLRAWRDLFPDCLVSSTLICREQVAAAYRPCGGYSNLEPRLPIPNRTVKRSRADDSAGYTARK